jgi:predicted peroxiredoxin
MGRGEARYTGAMTGRRIAIFLSHADETALRLAGSCALAAAAMGDRVDVFLFGPAVAAVVAATGDGEGAATLLHQARAAGTCRLHACSQSLVAERVDPGEAQGALDAVVGWPTVLEWTRGVVDRYFF